MREYKGRALAGRVTMGSVKVLKDDFNIAARRNIDDVDSEIALLCNAVAEGKNELSELKEQAGRIIGKEAADIFDAHMILIEDIGFIEGIKDMIRNNCVNASYAAMSVGNDYANKLMSLGDDILKARAVDMRDVAKRLAMILEKSVDYEKNAISVSDANAKDEYILVADDLSPSQFVSMDMNNILAIVTRKGSRHSHMAIMAGMMGIPVLVGAKEINLDELYDGIEAVLDPDKETVFFNPNENILKDYICQINEQKRHHELLKELMGKETCTKSGKKIALYANIGSLNSFDKAVENDAEGIGLFRSEFLYMGRKTAPDENEQFKVYSHVASAMKNKKVVIRTLDIGSDKQEAYLEMGHEANPAMGRRAIRFGLSRPDIFKVQIRALLRAAVYGNICIEYPMVSSVNEVIKARQLVDEVAEELKSEGISYRVPEQGVMIETPAAALIAEDLAKVSDFFSIGTNDLTQFSLAMGRLNNMLDDFYNPYHPAVMKLIKMTIDAAHEAGIKVGICGEIASDVSILEDIIKMGVDELSVSASKLLSIRKFIRELP